MGTNGGHCSSVQFYNMKPPHPNYSKKKQNNLCRCLSVRERCVFLYLLYWHCTRPWLRCRHPPPDCPLPFSSLFTSGRPDVVESIPDNPTYNVSSELTLDVSRDDDNALITCAVDHPSLAPGDKRNVYTLRVLCESTGKWGGVGRRGDTEDTGGRGRVEDTWM